ncbi:MAG TPA: hypothetical protein VIQ54_06045 [Polyangia bacterium]
MRFACWGLGVLAFASALSCRRHPLGGADGGDAGPPIVDAPTAIDATDAPGPNDAADAPGPIDATDASDGPAVLPVPCGALRALAAKGPFTDRHARNLLFSPDRRLLIVQAAGGPPDDLLLVPLPEGVPQMLLAGVRSAEWLGRSGQVLATMSSGDLVVASLDGTAPRTIARNTCAHLAVPDGSRVFAVSDCIARPIVGKLAEIDVATNTATPRSSEAANILAVSPSGRFAAFVAHDPDGDDIMHVLYGDRDLTLSPVAVDAPAFVAGERLLFLTPGSRLLSNAYLQVPGTNATSQLVAQDRHFGFRGYRISPDGSLALAAHWPATRQPPFATDLVTVRLDGAVGETLLANDLLPYDLNQLGISPFTFTADGRRVLFMASSTTSPMGVFTVQSSGGDRRQLALGSAFAVSPYADRVAILEIDSSTSKQTIHFVAAATGVEAFTVSSDGAIGGLGFVPGDRGLVYVERASPNRLHHVSFVDGRNTVIAAWNRSQTPLGDPPQGEIRTGYPVDPTGCFTIVDSDLPESAGTSLVVLPDAPE